MSADPAVLAQDIQRLEIELAERQRELAGLKRRLEPEPVKDCTLAGWSGPIPLSELFQGREGLILIHNMGRGCRYCTLWADGFNGVWRHLADRAGFGPFDPSCPVWPLIALLADGANGWEPRFRYAG